MLLLPRRGWARAVAARGPHLRRQRGARHTEDVERAKVGARVHQAPHVGAQDLGPVIVGRADQPPASAAGRYVFVIGVVGVVVVVVVVVAVVVMWWWWL